MTHAFRANFNANSRSILMAAQPLGVEALKRNAYGAWLYSSALVWRKAKTCNKLWPH